MTAIVLLIELLVFQLLLAAFGLAITSRSASPWRRHAVVYVPVALINLALIAIAIVLAVYRIPGVPVASVIGLAIAAIAGAAWLHRRARRRGPWSARPIGVWLAVAAVLLVQTHWQWRLAVANALTSRAAGNGGQTVGLLARPPASVTNAGPSYVSLGERLQADERYTDLEARAPDQLWSSDDPDLDITWDALAAALDDFDAQIDRLHALSRLPACGFIWTVPEDLYATELPEIGAGMAAASLVTWHGRLALHRGEHTAAIADGLALLRMGDHYATAPFLISQVVAASITTKGYDLVQAALADSTIAAWLEPLGPRALHRDWRQRLDDGLVLEELCLFRVLARLAAGSDCGDYSQTVALSMPPGYQTLMLLYGPALMRAEARSADAIFTDMRVRLRRSAAYDDPSAVLTYEISADQALGIWGQMLMPSIGRSAQRLAQADAQVRLVELAGRLIAHRRATGSWATSESLPVDADGHGWPADPFTDRPMRSRIEGDTLTVWSVGRDGDDDGGVTAAREDEGDLALTLRP